MYFYTASLGIAHYDADSIRGVQRESESSEEAHQDNA